MLAIFLSPLQSSRNTSKELTATKMLFSRSLVVLVSAISGIVAAQNNSYLTVTSLVTNAQNNSALECWKFTTPLTVPSTPGISGSMLYAFNLSTANEYTVIPARFDGGIHNAPAPQYAAPSHTSRRPKMAFVSPNVQICLLYLWTGAHKSAPWR